MKNWKAVFSFYLWHDEVMNLMSLLLMIKAESIKRATAMATIVAAAARIELSLYGHSYSKRKPNQTLFPVSLSENPQYLEAMKSKIWRWIHIYTRNLNGQCIKVTEKIHTRKDRKKDRLLIAHTNVSLSHNWKARRKGATPATSHFNSFFIYSISLYGIRCCLLNITNLTPKLLLSFSF